MKKFLKGFKEWLGIAGLAVGLVTACFGEDFMQNWGPPVFFFFAGFLTARAWDRYDRRHEEKERREEERRREEEERRREEEERRRKEEEEENTRRALRDLVAGLSDPARALLFELGESRAHLSFHRFGLKIDERRALYPASAGLELKKKGFLLSLGFKGDDDGFVSTFCLSEDGAAAFREGVAAGLFDGLED